MNKFWRVAWHEFKKHAFQKRFIFTILGIPFFLLAMAGMIYILVQLSNNKAPMGLVDLSQSINPSIEIIEAADLDIVVDVISYTDEATAMTALEEETIQAIFILPSNYPESIEVDVVYIEEPGDNAYAQMRYLLRANLLKEYSIETTNRVLEGFSPIVRTPDGLREFSPRNAINLALPVIGGIAFVILIMLSANYFPSIIAEEKENRTMEILATTVSPFQLIGGKIFGTILVVLTQVLSWVLLSLIAWQVAKTQINEVWIQNPELDFGTLLTILAILIPSYILYVSLITAVGAAATNVQEGQQIAGIFMMPLTLSYMFLALIMESPNSPIAVAISIFPLTAPTTMPIRIALTIVPTSQVILCAVILVISSVIAIWMASRAFELGMLRYGKKIRILEIFSKKPRLNS